MRRQIHENPVANLERSIRNRNVVLKVMLDENLIEQDEYDKAIAEDVVLRHKPAPITSDKKISPFFVDYVLKEIKNKYPDIDLSQGGYRVETTLDSRYQEIAEAAVAKGIRDNSRKKVNYGAAVLVSKNGFIRAMVGGPDYEKDQYNIAAQGGRQPGSSFKPIVYATAFERGALSASGYVSNEKFYIKENGRTRVVSGGGHGGSISVVSALASSNNSAACWAQARTGTMNVIHYAKERFGLREMPVSDTLALGVGDVTPLEMAEAYSVFQNHGTRTEPIAIRRIIGPDGLTVVRETAKQHKRMLAPKTADNLDAMLRSVVTSGTGRAARSAVNARGKTGTTSDNKDVWFCGYTDELIGIVWLGNVRQRVDKNGNRLSPIYEEMAYSAMGGQVAAPVWASMVSKAQKLANEKSRKISAAVTRSSVRDEPEEEEIAPEEEVPETSPVDANPATPPNNNGTGVTITPPPVTTAPPRSTTTGGGGGNSEPPAERLSVWICAESGQRATAYCPERVQRGFRRGSEPRSTCPLHRPPQAMHHGPEIQSALAVFLHEYFVHDEH